MSNQEQTGGRAAWKRTTLGVALPIRYGKARTEKHGTVREESAVYGSSGVIDTFERALTKGPTLIIGRKGTVGATHYSGEPCWPIDTVYFAEAEADKNLRFFKYLLDHLQLGKLDRSTAVPGLSRDDYNAMEVFVPEVNEQRRIVAEIEKQFTRLDAGVVGLRRVQANLKRYRAAVLKAACEGKLVPTEACLRQAERGRQAELARQEGRTLPAPRPGVFFVYAIRCDNDSIYIGQTQDLQKRWQGHVAGQAADWTNQHKPVLMVHYEECSSREEAVAREKWLKTGFGRKWLRREIAAGRARQAGYETGEQLLARILTERRQKWLGRGKYREATNPDTANLPPLPEGWTWATVEQLAAPEPNSITDGPFGSNLKTEHYTDSGPRVIRLQNIGDGIYVDEEAHISEAHFERLQKHRAFANDLVIAGFGENPPRSCIIPTTLGPAIVKADCIRFKPHSGVAAKYLNAALNSEPVRKRTKNMVHGVGRPRLNLGEIKSIVLPLPPIAEQSRIVAEVERRLSVVEELESVVAANLQRATRLRQAVLARAFSGQPTSHALGNPQVKIEAVEDTIDGSD